MAGTIKERDKEPGKVEPTKDDGEQGTRDDGFGPMPDQPTIGNLSKISTNPTKRK